MSEQIEKLIKQEKRILEAVRKTLSSVVRDVTPSNKSLKSPLTKATTDDLIMCFGLITAREKEIEQHLKTDNFDKPHFIDEVKTSHKVSLDSLKATLKKNDS